MIKSFDDFLCENERAGDAVIVAIAEAVAKKNGMQILSHRMSMSNRSSTPEEEMGATVISVKIFEVSYNDQQIMRCLTRKQAEAAGKSFELNDFRYAVHEEDRDEYSADSENEDDKKYWENRVAQLKPHIKETQDSFGSYEILRLAYFYKIDIEQIKKTVRGVKLSQELNID